MILQNPLLWLSIGAGFWHCGPHSSQFHIISTFKFQLGDFLANTPSTVIYWLSARSTNILDTWFGRLPLASHKSSQSASSWPVFDALRREICWETST